WALLVGRPSTALRPTARPHLSGAVLLATVARLAVFDVARRTIRARGLPRFAAAGLLAGSAWLALAGILWAGGGPTVSGARYDATLHAVFLGFTMSIDRKSVG